MEWDFGAEPCLFILEDWRAKTGYIIDKNQLSI